MMRPQFILAIFAWLHFSALSVQAERLPSFDHVQLAKESDHVVLVTEGAAIDGNVTVLASYKGNMAVGREISIPALKEFAKEDKRRIEPMFVGGELRHTMVTCSLMILFLNKDGDRLVPSSTEPSWNTWLCWIEDGVVYARWQEVNPGAVKIKEYGTGLDLKLDGSLREIMEASAQDKTAQETMVEQNDKVCQRVQQVASRT